MNHHHTTGEVADPIGSDNGQTAAENGSPSLVIPVEHPSFVTFARGYSEQTASLYDRLARRGQMTTIAAVTGRGKSLLITNISAHAIMRGRRVLWVDCDMLPQRTVIRLGSMLSDLCEDDLSASPEVRRALKYGVCGTRPWVQMDYTLKNCDESDWCTLFRHVDSFGDAEMVVIDGFDRYCTALSPDQVIRRCHEAAQWAATRNVALFVTSQITRNGANTEILGVDDLAFSLGKAWSAGTVAVIGLRESNGLRTISIAKDRSNFFSDQQVFRMSQSSSLRMEVLEVEDAVAIRAAGGMMQPEYVNCTEEECAFTGAHHEETSGGGDENCIAEEIRDEDPPDGGDGGMIAYSGLNGHVSIGRAVFGSATFGSRDMINLGRLLSLYEMASISARKLFAPGTRVHVALKRGQLMVSARMLGKRWGVDKNQAFRCLEQLERDGLVKTTKVRGSGSGSDGSGMQAGTRRKVLATVVTLCHYDSNDGADHKRAAGKKTSRRTA